MKNRRTKMRTGSFFHLFATLSHRNSTLSYPNSGKFRYACVPEPGGLLGKRFSPSPTGRDRPATSGYGVARRLRAFIGKLEASGFSYTCSRIAL